MKRRARKAGQSVRSFLRFVAVVAALLAGVVYWNFGTLSPCGVLREAIRRRGDLAAIFPDGVIDFGFEAQFGEMSANRCFAVLLKNLTSPVLYVAHYNLCRVHEALRSTPAMALGIADRVWTIGDLLDAALATQPIEPPASTAPERRRQFRIIEGWPQVAPNHPLPIFEYRSNSCSIVPSTLSSAICISPAM